jgi:hypothetical protein
MTVGLAASILIAVALGAATWTWVEQQRILRNTTRSALVNTALQEATGLEGQAQAAPVGDLVAWTGALAATQKARDLLEPGLDSRCAVRSRSCSRGSLVRRKRPRRPRRRRGPTAGFWTC